MAVRGSVRTIAISVGLGVAGMYFFDPRQGRRRRALVRDVAVGTWSELAAGLEQALRDARNRLQGVVAETRATFRDEELSEPQLVARVRAKLGRYVSHPSRIEVSAAGDRVTLRGPVLAHEMPALLDAVAAVRGVRQADNHLEPHGRWEEVPGLQTDTERTGERGEFLQANWAPGARLAAGVVGGALLAQGLRRSNPAALLVSTAGFGLLARAAANVEFGRLLGLRPGRRGIAFAKRLTIAAPIEQVYRRWSQIHDFPLFMRNVKQVRDLGDGRSEWTVAGPLGTPVQFVAVVTQQRPNEVLAWKSEAGEPIAHAGIVRFQPDRAGGTRVDLRLTYHPPAGATGHVVASLFGADPKRELGEDLVRMKTFLETGKLPRDAAARAV